MSWRESLKHALGPRWTATLRSLVRRQPLPRWGNLRRTTPFSQSFGFDRGQPVDRYYLNRFLDENRRSVRGDVLEIQSSDYTRRYGTDLRLTHSVDIDARHQPTYLCDLARSDGVIPSAAYDCVLLPCTLSLLRDVEGCLRQATRALRPGGTLLATAACLMPLIPDAGDYWRLTAAGWEELARRLWPDGVVEVRAYGNCLAATAAMMGLAWEELEPVELDEYDPRYPVMVSIRVTR